MASVAAHYNLLADSTFMDLTNYRGNASGEPAGGVLITGPIKLSVALVLDRANDPTALLQSGGGDRDLNDLVVRLDFTSASGYGWLVSSAP